MIINMKQPKIRRLIEMFITLFGWIFLLVFLYNVFNHFHTGLNYHFYLLNLSNTNAIMLFTVFSLVASSGLMMWWSFYNKRKYGPLKRRKFPTPANNQEMAVLFEISEEDVKNFQENNYIEIK